jgi:hypothetical protein
MMLGIELGAGIYEMRVLVPLWSSSPPHSIIAYDAQPLRPDPGRNFWIFATTFLGLVSIANLFPAWRSTGMRRRWWLFGAGLTVLVIISTFGYFVPTLLKIHGRDLPAGEVIAMTNWWVRLNWLRAALVFIAWVATLRAFSYGRPAD